MPKPCWLAMSVVRASIFRNVEQAFGPVGMCGFDRVWLSEDASRGCCSGPDIKAAKRSTWQPPVDSRPRCLGSKVSVEATSVSRVVEASCREAADRMSVA